MKKLITISFLLFAASLYSIDIAGYTYTSYPQEANVMFLNPANVALLNKFVLTTGYGILLKNVVKNNLSNSVVSLVYSGDRLFFGCGIQSLVLDSIYSENCYLLNFGIKTFKKLFLGMNVKMYEFKYEFDEYYVNDPLAQQKTQLIQDFTFGITTKISENLNFGFAIDNISVATLGKDIKYHLPQKFIMSLGYIYGITLVNFDVLYQHRKVENNIFSDIGGKITLNQQLFYTKYISCDATVGVQKVGNLTELNLSFQTRLISNKIGIRYIWSYPVSEISGFAGNHYFLVSFQPLPTVKKRKVVKYEQPQEIIEEVVVTPKKKRIKKIIEKVEVSTGPTQVSYEVKPSTYLPELTTQLLKPTTAEVVVVEQKVVKKEFVYIREEPTIKFPVAHKVKEGETLVSLAEKYYKNKKLWRKIYEANKDKIIKGVPIVGEVLIIPEP